MLKQQCKYCKKNGHTPKHCPELEGKYEQSAKPRHEQPVKHEPKGKPSSLLPVPIIENKNNFKSLALNDGFPVVGEKDSGKIIRPAPVKLNAWASVVTKGPQKTAQAPAEQKQQEEQPQAPAEQKQPQAEQPKEQPKEQPQEAPAEQQADEYIPQDYSKCSWADY
jgi:hypothetical protein